MNNYKQRIKNIILIVKITEMSVAVLIDYNNCQIPEKLI